MGVDSSFAICSGVVIGLNIRSTSASWRNFSTRCHLDSLLSGTSPRLYSAGAVMRPRSGETNALFFLMCLLLKILDFILY
jgi:hypothetical protein